MEREIVVRCCECQQPIVSGERFVRFKVPGKETYQFFHWRFHVGDSSEGCLKRRT